MRQSRDTFGLASTARPDQGASSLRRRAQAQPKHSMILMATAGMARGTCSGRSTSSRSNGAHSGGLIARYSSAAGTPFAAQTVLLPVAEGVSARCLMPAAPGAVEERGGHPSAPALSHKQVRGRGMHARVTRGVAAWVARTYLVGLLAVAGVGGVAHHCAHQKQAQYKAGCTTS